MVSYICLVGTAFSSGDVVHHVHKCSHFPSTSAGVRHALACSSRRLAGSDVFCFCMVVGGGGMLK